MKKSKGIKEVKDGLLKELRTKKEGQGSMQSTRPTKHETTELLNFDIKHRHTFVPL